MSLSICMDMLIQEHLFTVSLCIIWQDMDPRMTSWKGAAILASLDTAQELWIRPNEWQQNGVKILRERAPFVWWYNKAVACVQVIVNGDQNHNPLEGLTGYNLGAKPDWRPWIWCDCELCCNEDDLGFSLPLPNKFVNKKSEIKENTCSIILRFVVLHFPPCEVIKELRDL